MKKVQKQKAGGRRSATKKIDGATTFEREYKGKKYTLTSVAKDGKQLFELHDGKSAKECDSLTAAAKEVTGYSAISGPAFWSPKGKKKQQAEA